MKPLRCEMCNSPDIIKQDDFFVCRHCGTKFSVEGAKKRIDDVVDIGGSVVNADNSDFVQKCLQNARRAKEKEDWDETEKYYNLVEQNDPANIEAIFYSAYGKAKASLSDGDLNKRQDAFKVLYNSIKLIGDNYSLEKEKEELPLLEQINNDIFAMITGNYVYNVRKNGFGIVMATDKDETRLLFRLTILTFATVLTKITEKYEVKERYKVKKLYLMNIKIYESCREDSPESSESTFNEFIVNQHKKIKEFEPNHAVPIFDKVVHKDTSDKSSGCYIATCVYGSYDCPQVWTLRRYRDYILAETWYGRLFIHTYYAISPIIVKRFGDTIWFKKMWKGKLDRIVLKLQQNGVESTPYKDKH